MFPKYKEYRFQYHHYNPAIRDMTKSSTHDDGQSNNQEKQEHM